MRVSHCDWQQNVLHLCGVVSSSEKLSVRSSALRPAGEELANTISHGFGFIAAVVGAPVLILAAANRGTAFFFGTVIFAVTLSILYLGSTLYHAWPTTRGKHALKLFDHSAIFLLIAGTYTPFTLGPLRAVGGLNTLVLVWALAIFGVLLKVIRGTSRHSKFALSLYVGAGWSGVLGVRPFTIALPPITLIWLIAGGIAYTAGVLFFLNKRLRYAHFIWHLFVLAGSTCHFAALLSCAS
jgi:hemolysin III